jgi:hypothetical protein
MFGLALRRPIGAGTAASKQASIMQMAWKRENFNRRHRHGWAEVLVEKSGMMHGG